MHLHKQIKQDFEISRNLISIYLNMENKGFINKLFSDIFKTVPIRPTTNILEHNGGKHDGRLRLSNKNQLDRLKKYHSKLPSTTLNYANIQSTPTAPLAPTTVPTIVPSTVPTTVPTTMPTTLSTTVPVKSVTMPQNKIGGSTRQVNINDPTGVFKRIFLILFVVILSIYLTTRTFISTKLLLKIIKLPKEDDGPEDPYFENAIDSKELFYVRWRRIIQLIIVFSAFVVLYVIVVIIICFILVFLMWLIYYSFLKMFTDFNEKITPLSFNNTIYFIQNSFWSFDDNGTPYTMLYFYALIIAIIFGSVILVMLYFLIIRGYFTNLAYQGYINTDKTDKEEYNNSAKFTIHYAIYVILLILFSVLLFSFYVLLEDKKAFLIVCIFLIMIVLMFALLIFKYTLERTKFLRIIMIWFAFLLWTIFIYAIFGLSWSL